MDETYAEIGTHRVYVNDDENLECLDCGTVAAPSDSGRGDLLQQTCDEYKKALGTE